jgi:hypothetical protein
MNIDTMTLVEKLLVIRHMIERGELLFNIFGFNGNISAHLRDHDTRVEVEIR